MNIDPFSSKSKKCKAYSVVIELEIQAVTCPGVWLCNSGKVTMQIFLLSLCTQTSTMNPVFPLLCHEKFIFRKNFSNIQNLCDIDKKLDKEVVYMELIQWENCDTGNVLATFKTSLNELLYPFPSCKGVVAGVDVDLLMEATRIFPGIIAPKVEVSTKFTIEEILCTVKNERQSDVIVINPKLISSKCVPKRSVPAHQKKVCHNNKYHKNKTAPKTTKQKNCCEVKRSSPRPRSAKLVQNLQNCGCDNEKPNLKSNWVYEKVRQLRSRSPEPQLKCTCKDNKVSCALCTKYKYYFMKDLESAAPSSLGTCRLCSCKKTKACPDDDQSTLKQFRTCNCDMSEKSLKLPTCSGNNQPKQKFASEIHERLQRALSTPSCLSYLSAKNNSCDGSCNERFYRNLEHFYKQLYLRAHYKLKNEHCKCPQKH